MHPHLHERFHAERGLTLRDLTFMMRKDVVFAAGVNVDLTSEDGRAHRGALDMPARETRFWIFPFGMRHLARGFQPT